MGKIHDVIVVGSGSAALTAALRACDHGLDVLIVEKTHKIGGTSATSGGVTWIPNHGLGTSDSRQQALDYIYSVANGPIRKDRVEAFVDEGPRMVAYLKSIGIEPVVMPWPDYFSEMPAARADRSIVFPKYDGRRLGAYFPLVREQFTRFKLMNRYSMDFAEANTISTRSKGWMRAVLAIMARYWLDFGTRRLTRRDRIFTLGAAMIGPMVERLLKRGVEFRLGTAVKSLIVEDGRVTGVEGTRFGRKEELRARHGVIVCAGGFEWSQKLRDKFMTVPGDIRDSSTPEGANTGQMLEAGMAIGAATEFTETGWFVPTMSMPLVTASNFEEIHQSVFDVGRPHSVCVNRNGDRFVDEACGYDRFGNAMMDDQLKTGANAPCWHVFDATFRSKFTAGGIMPTALMPDSKIPVDWWDHYIFRADSIRELAAKIEVAPDKLEDVVRRMNDYACTGVDPEFGRGSTAYDRTFGDPAITPNPCLGPIDKGPFYAVPVGLGDLGCKGGLKADAKARVLDQEGRPIPGLYAAGNAAGSPFGNCYPGAGGTIGPAMTFGYVAANAIAQEAKSSSELGQFTHNMVAST
ncbi:FAD-dependent oxidoreductase [Novosphingobium sp. KCTC 2891]|uniref:FAD-dependent oxidoreductase n=1 Tax=Novosphingobium sp. KCTC 2891 TaxID=2989730 RepID=UPI0022224FEF|nr:FAD-dependent oxidoreductase [Novosphingobium sp. KCTC 2891]MCW1384896.1 FAD-dependent oxidoreductase [Novosphingobium sp. KCTC 2891]